jgi:hypothetical protein
MNTLTGSGSYNRFRCHAFNRFSVYKMDKLERYRGKSRREISRIIERGEERRDKKKGENEKGE